MIKNKNHPSPLTTHAALREASLILGYYGFGNLGDELLLLACIKILNERGIENKNIIVLSNNPEETRKNFNVESVNRWKIFEVVKALRKSKNLILGGGGLFQDSTSIKSCFYYWGVVRLAKLFKLKIFALGQSIGPLNSKLANFLTRNALRLCDKVQVRDENSFNLAKEFHCQNLELGQDLVLKLGEGRQTLACRQAGLILVNLRPYKNLEKFVNIIAPNVKNFNGKKIGAALSVEDEEILINNKEILGLDEIKLLKNFDDAQKLFSQASSALGMRLHFGVLAKIFGTPAALMPYDVKVSEFAKQYKIPVVSLSGESYFSIHNYDKICS